MSKTSPLGVAIIDSIPDDVRELASMLGLDSKQVIQEAREEVGRDPKRNWDDEIKALGEHVRRFCRGR